MRGVVGGEGRKELEWRMGRRRSRGEVREGRRKENIIE
jgi:hypothetical protein